MTPVNYHEWMKRLIAEAHEDKYLYLISCKQGGTKYFYYDYEAWPPESDYFHTIQLFWTQVPMLAFPFGTEEEVEEFKADYVSPREASIVRIERPPNSIFKDM